MDSLIVIALGIFIERTRLANTRVVRIILMAITGG